LFIDWQQLKAAGGEARVGGDVSNPAVGMLIFASPLGESDFGFDFRAEPDATSITGD
jgi:hypothetical protein